MYFAKKNLVESLVASIISSKYAEGENKVKEHRHACLLIVLDGFH